MNKCELHDTFLDGNIWVPSESLSEVENCLRKVSQNRENVNNAQLEEIRREGEKSPTFIPVNEFTQSFQLVVDTYGIPRYNEINPGYFCIVTFPFLFGVMFGDIGHGGFLFLFAIYLIVNSNELKRGILKEFLFAKWFLFLMGFYALFCGFLYNDFLGLPLYFRSCYNDTGDKGDTLYRKENCVNHFGLDPAWMISSNELAFVNSLKMKLSVILGVSQMVLGIVLKGLNHIYWGEICDFIFSVIPEIVLMLSLFGYMNFLVFVKWNTNYEGELFKAPDIKSYLMDIFLKFGKLPSEPINPQTGKQEEWKLLADKETMEKIHLIILISSLVCIILMFLPKVIIDYLSAKAKYNKQQIQNNLNVVHNDYEIGLVNNMEEEQMEEPKFTDFFVNNVIETIEFVLGTVSNTASYLRLWALSLAHSQLSIVFFSMIIVKPAITGNFIVNGLILSFASFSFLGITLVVLLFMDMMECFLHTLRLHWVEFQNKFYKADGQSFIPFCFSKNLSVRICEL